MDPVVEISRLIVENDKTLGEQLCYAINIDIYGTLSITGSVTNDKTQE